MVKNLKQNKKSINLINQKIRKNRIIIFRNFNYLYKLLIGYELFIDGINAALELKCTSLVIYRMFIFLQYSDAY